MRPFSDSSLQSHQETLLGCGNRKYGLKTFLQSPEISAQTSKNEQRMQTTKRLQSASDSRNALTRIYVSSKPSPCACMKQNKNSSVKEEEHDVHIEYRGEHKNCYVDTFSYFDFTKINLLTLPRILPSYLLFMNAFSFCQLFYALFVIFLLSQTTTTNAYVLTQDGGAHTYLHRRLAGKERREVQREILSVLGLNHRPHPNNQKPIGRSSAPLYMLGLYSSVSTDLHHSQSSHRPYLQNDIGESETPHQQSRLETRSAKRFASRSSGPFTLDPMTDGFPNGIAPDLSHYIQESGILTNEVGIFETNSEQLRGPVQFSDHSGRHFGLATNEGEKRLLDQSDLVISFINTKQQRGLGTNIAPSTELRVILRRHRSFYFDVNQASLEDQLAASKFRLYKEKSDPSIGNQTLRVNVYQAVRGSDGSTSVYLLGSRLVGSNQEGWLVYDVTSTLQEWIGFPDRNLGLKVTAETVEGRYLKATKTGLVGRKGDPTKQAFMVAFFSQHERPRVHSHLLRRRVKRSSDREMEENNESEITDDDIVEDEEDVSPNANDSRNGESIFDVEEVEEQYDEETDEDALTTNNSQSTSNSPQSEASRSISRRRTRAKEQRPKKKNRRRKRPKNSSKRKQAAEHCHRKPLYVNFRDLGWDTWIIAPPGYPAYQCSGECSFPLNAQMNATNHAIVQSLVHLSLPQMKIPEPCCSPTSLESISVLYYNDRTNVVYKKYRNMIVSSCGCN